MLIEADKSALLLVDVQEKLLPGVFENEKLVASCKWLIGVAQLMNVPVLGSEQYPQGVGPTVTELRELLPEDDFIGKTHFSCADAPECSARIEALGREQIVICGMESHVCVMQTALRLHAQGKQVYVVTDAISARNPVDTNAAIERMREEGIKMVTREMVGFEWIGRSDAPQFKTFSMNYLR
ncbi:MAG: hydrolase [Neptuniibacter caesariensis]|uniref:Hydrolase n=1 Tax=Neptuniibacter caesariensis TaxID=207954 RepID=A0A2G6JAA9_NEPCE|nr:MAG: hydrolase [Neptuniibacter caesariensis]